MSWFDQVASTFRERHQPKWTLKKIFWMRKWTLSGPLYLQNRARFTPYYKAIKISSLDGSCKLTSNWSWPFWFWSGQHTLSSKNSVKFPSYWEEQKSRWSELIRYLTDSLPERWRCVVLLAATSRAQAAMSCLKLWNMAPSAHLVSFGHYVKNVMHYDERATSIMRRRKDICQNRSDSYLH